MANVVLTVQAKVEDALKNIDRLTGGIVNFQNSNLDAAGAAGVFGVNLSSLNSPLTAVAGAMKASIDYSIQWTNTIDDVQKITGQTAEETSKLVTVLGDFGIEAGVLKGAARALKEQGLSPNLETIKKLAEQYQSIQDPAKRVEWGTKTLGRAFFDLSEVLSKTPEEFEAVEAAAMSSGKVIGQDMVDQMEAAQIKSQQLADKVDGLKLALGVPLVNTLSDAADGADNFTKLMGALNLTVQKSIGIIDEEQAALRANALVAGDLSAVYEEQFSPAVTGATDAVDRQVERVNALNSSVVTVTPNVDAMTASAERWKGIAAQAEAEAALKQRLDDLTGAASDLQFGMGELTTATLFHAAAEGLSADEAYNLAEKMGLIDESAAAAKDILDAYRAQLESGAISAGTYAARVAELNTVASLLDGKVVTVQYIENYRREFQGEQNRGDDRQGGAIGDGYSAGTGGNWLTVPSGYPNDSYPIRLSSGERFAVIPSGGNSTTMGNVSINISGAGHPQAVAAAVRDELAKMGRSADTRIRTR